MDDSTLTKCYQLITKELEPNTHARIAFERMFNVLERLSQNASDNEKATNRIEDLDSLCENCFQVRCCHNRCCCEYRNGEDQVICRSIGKELFEYYNERIWDRDIDLWLDKIKTNLKRNSLPIHIILKENYITDIGLKKICQFILEDQYIRTHLEELNLQNNRIGMNSVCEIKSLLDTCSNMSLNLKINLISEADIAKVLKKDYPNLQCRPY